MIEALQRVTGGLVSRETTDLLEAYVAMVTDANSEQNLISASSIHSIWERHVLDSAQLVRFENKTAASWVDIGSGAGFPGIVIAALIDGSVTLVEPRRLRADFLMSVVEALGLSRRVSVQAAKIERVEGPFDMITARAVAPLVRLIAMANHLAHSGTVWALPKGKSAQSELAEARRSWQCDARSEMSCTDPDAQILILSKMGQKPAR